MSKVRFVLDKEGIRKRILQSEGAQKMVKSYADENWGKEDHVNIFNATTRAMAINWTLRNKRAKE